MMFVNRFLLLGILYLFLSKVVIGAELQCVNRNNAIPSTTAHLQDNVNGTVSDPETLLMWKKCVEGQFWNAVSNSCQGSGTKFTWEQALLHAQTVNAGGAGERLSYTDWYVPNVKEISSIIESSCWHPSINSGVFPSTPYDSFYLSSSPEVRVDPDKKRVYGADFGEAFFGRLSVSGSYYLRLVRRLP